jgi:hypothetical protein
MVLAVEESWFNFWQRMDISPLQDSQIDSEPQGRVLLRGLSGMDLKLTTPPTILSK